MSNVLRVGQADIQRKLTLGGGDQLGVLEADLDGYPVLGLVAEALAGVVGPGPGGRRTGGGAGGTSWSSPSRSSYWGDVCSTVETVGCILK